MPDDSAGGLTEPAFIERMKRRRRRRRGLIAAGLAVVVALGSWLAVSALTPGSGCGTGMSAYQGECVGVNADGTARLDPSLAGIENDIAGQDSQVTADDHGDYLSVALLTSLTTGAGSDVTLARIRQELEGAYAAQQSWNKQGFRPAINLLLTNEGSSQQAWTQVVGELKSLPSADHLVAVVGVGLSNTATVRAAQAMAAWPDPIPMVGSVDTADGLNSDGLPPSLAALVGQQFGGHLPGLFRVAPTTGDEVTLLKQYLTSHPAIVSRKQLARAIVVYDTSSSDLYTATLRIDFQAAFGPYLHERYDADPSTQAIVNQFNNIAGVVCPQGSTAVLPLVLYAGRESTFPTFINQLRQLQSCPAGSRITVITGADAEGLPVSSTAPNPGGPAIEVIFPNLSDKDKLSYQYTQAFAGPSVVKADVTASWGVMTYDAVAAVEQAARKFVNGSATLLPSRGDLADTLADFNAASNAVVGATGDFLFQQDGDEGCQLVPVVIDRNGGSGIVFDARPRCPA
jgi:hypothetical protein